MYKICIVDADKHSSDILETMINEFGTEQCIKFEISKFKSAEECLEANGACGAIVFTEIALPSMDGVNFAKKISNDSIVIFCSELISFAIVCYAVSAVDFLVKPLDRSLFCRALKKALNRFDNKHIQSLYPIWKIIYIEVRQHYLYYHISANGSGFGEIIRIRGTMMDAEKRLSNYGFVRCNEAYLLNFNYIKFVKGFSVYLYGTDDVVPISKKRKKDFLKSLKSFYRYPC